MNVGKRIGNIPPKEVGIVCRHRKAKTRRGWGLCPRCHNRYIEVVAPERVLAITEQRRAQWRAYADKKKEELRALRLSKPKWIKRDKHMRRKYGITIYQFNQMLRQQ